MTDEKGGCIWILTAVAEDTASREYMFPSIGRITAETNKVLTTELRKNLAAIAQELTVAFESLPTEIGGYEVDTIALALAVNGAGKVSLVGELSAGLSSSITLTLKRSTHGRA